MAPFKRPRLVAVFSIAFMGFGAAACATRSGDGGAAAENASDLLGGFPAESTAFDAVGNIAELTNTAGGGQFMAKCTGTLIGPHTVLAAGHCVQKYKGRASLGYTEHYFRIGFDSAKPTQTVRIVSGAVGPHPDGGSEDVGADIGIFQLASDIEGVTPIPVSTEALTNDDIKKTFLQVGYGIAKSTENVGPLTKRQIGSQELVALRGNAFVALFPNVADLVAYVQPIFPGATAADVSPLYADPSLDVLDGLQGFFSGARIHGVQPCFGDSGGPALRSAGGNGKFEVVAVQSSVFTADSPPCWGGSSQGLVTQADAAKFVKDALADQSRGLTVAGYCNADTVIRGNPASDWIDPVSLLECAPLGLACATDKSGNASCDSPKPLVGPATTCSIIGKFTHPNGAVFEFLADGTYTVRGKPYGKYTFTNGVLSLDENAGSDCDGSIGSYALTFDAACTQYTLNVLQDGCRLRSESYDNRPYTQPAPTPATTTNR